MDDQQDPGGASVALASLLPDPRNARRHGDRNRALIAASLRELGAARSVVVDEDGVVLAGNATVAAAAEAGIGRVRVVEADGTELVAVRRSGLTAGQKRRLALLDNRAAELADWDAEALAALAGDTDLSGLWGEDELAALLGAGADGGPLPEVALDPGADRYREQYGVIVVCEDEAHQEKVYEALAADGYNCKVVVT